MLSFIPKHIRGYFAAIDAFVTSEAAPATEGRSVSQNEPPEQETTHSEPTEAPSLVSTPAEERDKQLAKYKQRTEDLLAQFQELQERQAQIQRRILIADRKRALHAATHSAVFDLVERRRIRQERGQSACISFFDRGYIADCCAHFGLQIADEDSRYLNKQTEKVWLLAHSSLPPPPPNNVHPV